MIAHFDVYTFDSERRLVTERGGAPVHLTQKAFDLLGLLIAEAPRVVTKNDLHQRLWPDAFVSDATLVSLIKELRRMLPSRESDTPTIRTSHGIGYAFSGRLVAGTSRHPGVAHWIAAKSGRIELHPGENLIGRDPSAVVWIDVAGVSRRHARIVVTDREARLEDLGSKNGTTLRGVRLTSAAVLRDGDDVAVGPIVLCYRTSKAGVSTETVNGLP